MLVVHGCEKCKNNIKIKIMKGFAHISCEHCKQNYMLKQRSVKYYIILPFVSVSISVYLSVNYIKTSDIFIKAVFILSVSYMIYLIFGMILVKTKILEYEKKE